MAGSLFLLFTYSSRRRLFINQIFFEQLRMNLRPRRYGTPGAPAATQSLYQRQGWQISNTDYYSTELWNRSYLRALRYSKGFSNG